jgi:hypothetical protein
LPLDRGVHRLHARIALGEVEPELAVQPVGDPGRARLVVDRDADRPPEQPGRVEDVVDLLVLQQPVDVHPSARDVEVGAEQRVVGRHRHAAAIAHEAGDLGQAGGVDLVAAGQADQLDQGALQR